MDADFEEFQRRHVDDDACHVCGVSQHVACDDTATVGIPPIAAVLGADAIGDFIGRRCAAQVVAHGLHGAIVVIRVNQGADLVHIGGEFCHAVSEHCGLLGVSLDFARLDVPIPPGHRSHLHGQLQPPRRLIGAARFAFQPADVDKGDEDAVHGIFLGAVGHDTHEERFACTRGDLLLHRLQILYYCADVVHQLVVCIGDGEMIERPAEIGVAQVRDARERRRELADAEMAIEIERTDLDVFQQIVDVVVEADHLLNLGLVLGIDRVQLLVDGLQFLVGALQLFVRGNQLLVGRLQLFIRRFQLLDGRLQVFLCELEFAFDIGQAFLNLAVSRDGNTRGRSDVLASLLRPEAEQHVATAPVFDDPPLQVDTHLFIGCQPWHVFIDDLGARLAQAPQQAVDDEVQLLRQQVEQMLREAPRSQVNEAVDIVEDMDDVVVLVDQNRRRRKEAGNMLDEARGGATAQPQGAAGLHCG